MDEFFKNKKFKKDTLTGLYDREVIVEYASSLLEKKNPFSLILIDIDNFKNVNDNYGHSACDRIIREVADRINRSIGSAGIVGRFGGDEFIIVVKDIVEYDAIWTFCRGFFKNVDGFSVEDIPGCYITCTLGLSRFPEDGNDYSTLMAKTDKALYRGKMKGRSCFIIYLDSKHKNIVLHSSDDTTASPMQRLTSMYRLFTAQKDLKSGIKAILENFSSSMMIDHLALQSEDNMLFSTVYPLAKFKDFNFIENKLIEKNISAALGVYYLNERRQLKDLKQEKLENILENQNIKSTAWAVISYNDKKYGYIRADAVSNTRIWQHDDLELITAAANAIAAALHYQNKELDDLI